MLIVLHIVRPVQFTVIFDFNIFCHFRQIWLCVELAFDAKFKRTPNLEDNLQKVWSSKVQRKRWVREKEREERESTKCNLSAVVLSFRFDVTPLQYLSVVLSAHDRSIISKDRSHRMPNRSLFSDVFPCWTDTLSQTSAALAPPCITDHSLGRYYANAGSI